MSMLFSCFHYIFSLLCCSTSNISDFLIFKSPWTSSVLFSPCSDPFMNPKNLNLWMSISFYPYSNKLRFYEIWDDAIIKYLSSFIYVCHIHSAYIHIFIYVYVLCKPKNIIILEIRKTSLKLEKLVVAMNMIFSPPKTIWEWNLRTLKSQIFYDNFVKCYWLICACHSRPICSCNPNLLYLRLWLHWR